ncbi:MAG: L,D-transpeptidase family protein, partial [Planctomycetes bacterium]|nr:L,D-transpeptidase family protein [Planctomycetota bacterium]
TTNRAKSLIAAGRQALVQNDLVTARSHFSEAFEIGVDDEDATVLRAELTRLGNETIFSPRAFANDPLVTRYTIQPGDALAKIATSHKTSADLLANINGIRDKHLIRAGQTIKVVDGPFRAVVDKGSFSLDVYLGSTFVRHYPVGLGADDSTPTGEWRVATKLTNPTYYPPRGGKIIAADDPQNPLGERWIGLVGVGGEALGQERYGIHGTIEPDSIGRAASMGCIRLHNEDVEELYTFLVEKHSTVTIR